MSPAPRTSSRWCSLVRPAGRATAPRSATCGALAVPHRPQTVRRTPSSARAPPTPSFSRRHPEHGRHPRRDRAPRGRPPRSIYRSRRCRCSSGRGAAGVAVQRRRHREVGAESGVTDGAVRMLLHRARSTMRTAATADAVARRRLARRPPGLGRRGERGRLRRQRPEGRRRSLRPPPSPSPPTSISGAGDDQPSRILVAATATVSPLGASLTAGDPQAAPRWCGRRAPQGRAPQHAGRSRGRRAAGRPGDELHRLAALLPIAAGLPRVHTPRRACCSSPCPARPTTPTKIAEEGRPAAGGQRPRPGRRQAVRQPGRAARPASRTPAFVTYDLAEPVYGLHRRRRTPVRRQPARPHRVARRRRPRAMRRRLPGFTEPLLSTSVCPTTSSRRRPARADGDGERAPMTTPSGRAGYGVHPGSCRPSLQARHHLHVAALRSAVGGDEGHVRRGSS